MNSRVVSRPAPTGGLVMGETVAPDPLGALVLDNWFPTKRGIRVRGGRRKVAGLNAPVTSIFSFDTALTGAIFAATETDVFDITNLNPDAVLTPILTGRTGGEYVSQQIGTVGGQFLIVCNGADPTQTFNGATFSDTALTFSPAGPSSSDLSAVWSYRNRLFFIQKESLTAWFLPVDTVAGELRDVSLAGVFQRGGSLLFGTTWSLDAGDGIDDKCVFVSTEGEVAVYEGGDPANIDDWRLVGRYDVGVPMGPKGFMRAGGDVLILTKSGAISLAQAIQRDAAALTSNSVTSPIEPLWKAEAERQQGSWQIVKWSARSLALVTIPKATRNRMLAVNLETGKWGTATNWGATCAEVYRKRAFAGIGNEVFALDEGGQDGGSSFTARACFSFAAAEDNVSLKVVNLMRAVFVTASDPGARLGVAVDYNPKFNAEPDAPIIIGDEGSRWGSARWGIGRWQSTSSIETRTLRTRWSHVRNSGISIAPTIQIRSDSAAALSVELLQIDMSVETGGAIV